MHAELMLDDSIIMIGDASPEYPANKLLIHVYVSDVDEVFRRALAAGGTQDQAPQQTTGRPRSSRFVQGLRRQYLGYSHATLRAMTLP
jgi:uncharacterized glyoxalase superfamily protein PhnB